MVPTENSFEALSSLLIDDDDAADSSILSAHEQQCNRSCPERTLIYNTADEMKKQISALQDNLLSAENEIQNLLSENCMLKEEIRRFENRVEQLKTLAKSTLNRSCSKRERDLLCKQRANQSIINMDMIVQTNSPTPRMKRRSKAITPRQNRPNFVSTPKSSPTNGNVHPKDSSVSPISMQNKTSLQPMVYIVGDEQIRGVSSKLSCIIHGQPNNKYGISSIVRSDLKESECGLRMNDLLVKCLLYADDQVILASSAEELQEMELKHYLDSSKNGVIYMSFGTNTDPTLLPRDFISKFVKVFCELPYDVLWKWNGDELPGRCKNIRTEKWFPQPDLLKDQAGKYTGLQPRHPNIKAFVTQGGLQSTGEAITAGVPLVGIPMLVDQWYNVEKYVRLNIGVQLDLETLTEAQLKNAITTVIEDESYRHNIKKLDGILRDEPMSGLDRAVWWTEYVLRHKGARHLRAPAANITWAQYLELELVSLILALGLADSPIGLSEVQAYCCLGWAPAPQVVTGGLASQFVCCLISSYI
ncbi:UDP-glucoronosyl and UDP-glucosyl transferase domain-containing protein [Phthorimaea operculella]|nr:UDP-glucoronosyl and UDP-glucosyl transferase domain-containing protein [Phthorimaea operculella]